jgi:hypothetical protein
MQAIFRHIYRGTCPLKKLVHRKPWQTNPHQAHKANWSHSGSAILWGAQNTWCLMVPRSSLHGECRDDHDLHQGWAIPASFFKQLITIHPECLLQQRLTSVTEIGPLTRAVRAINLAPCPCSRVLCQVLWCTKFPSGTNASTRCNCTSVYMLIHKSSLH